MPLTLQAYDPNVPHNHNNGLSFIAKSHSPKRSLHIFDSIQSIFQSNNHHNHSFNHRHHNHDKKHKHNHNHNVDRSTTTATTIASTIPSSAHQSNAKSNTSPLKCSDSRKAKAKGGAEDKAIDSDGQRNEHDVRHSSDFDADSTTGAPSKILNVTRILINSTNTKNGKYD